MYCIKCKEQIEDDSIYCRFCGKKLQTTTRPKALKRANGTGSVVKLSGRRRKPWQVLMTINGERKSIGTFETKTEALMKLEETYSGNMSVLYDATVEDIYKIVVAQNVERLTESGLTNYRSGYKYLEPYAKMKMRDIRTAHIQRAISDAAEKGIGYSSWKKIQNIASLMCKVAMANDLIDKNYAQLITLPAAPQKSDKISFSDAQVERLWELWETDNVIMAVLALCYNGMRIGEFLSLKKSDVDMSERVIYAQGSKTEAGKNRIIAIPNDVAPLYHKMLQTPGEYLYPSPSGKVWDIKNFRDRSFYPTLEKYGLDTNEGERITPHSCRHTYAALCVKYELSEKATMDLIGHSKYSTTLEIYANSTRRDVEFLRSEADKIKRKKA
jgi:integrase